MIIGVGDLIMLKKDSSLYDTLGHCLAEVTYIFTPREREEGFFCKASFDDDESVQDLPLFRTEIIKV